MLDQLLFLSLLIFFGQLSVVLMDFVDIKFLSIIDKLCKVDLGVGLSSINLVIDTSDLSSLTSLFFCIHYVIGIAFCLFDLVLASWLTYSDRATAIA